LPLVPLASSRLFSFVLGLVYVVPPTEAALRPTRGVCVPDDVAGRNLLLVLFPAILLGSFFFCGSWSFMRPEALPRKPMEMNGQACFWLWPCAEDRLS
jgi:hypothetical protein